MDKEILQISTIEGAKITKKIKKVKKEDGTFGLGDIILVGTSFGEIISIETGFKNKIDYCKYIVKFENSEVFEFDEEEILEKKDIEIYEIIDEKQMNR